MIAYRNSQMGYLIIALVVAAMILIFAVTPIEEIGLGHYLLLLGLIISLVLFYKLNVVVDHGVIVCSFGQGMISKTIRVAELSSCRVVKVPWYYGWGIRLTPKGWMYNVSGAEAVEVTYKSGKRFTIGSNEAESLCEAIQDEIKKYP